MLLDYTLLYPPAIHFGWGALNAIPQIAASLHDGQPARRVFIVATRSFFASEKCRKLQESMNICGTNTGIPHDPPLATVDELIGEMRGKRADTVLAVGGGSVIDAAKAAAVLAPLPGAAVRPYFEGKLPLERPGLRVIAAPTTAGTGAEITKNSVLTDPDRRIKQSLRSPYMVPAAAVIDPELTVSMPAELTAASGLDALTQALESFLSAKANAVSRALARDAVVLLVKNLPTAYREPENQSARTATAEGSMLSAMAFSQSGLGAVHGLAHPLGAVLAIPHGITCAILLPHILVWNAPDCQIALGELAQALGLASTKEVLEQVSGLCRELGIPKGFGKLGLQPTHFGHILQNCRSNSMKCNPRPMTDADITELLMQLSSA
jgi:alcohol dehydrogenase class IV